jgi:hypothetical protein
MSFIPNYDKWQAMRNYKVLKSFEPLVLTVLQRLDKRGGSQKSIDHICAIHKHCLQSIRQRASDPRCVDIIMHQLNQSIDSADNEIDRSAYQKLLKELMNTDAKF